MRIFRNQNKTNALFAFATLLTLINACKKDNSSAACSGTPTITAIVPTTNRSIALTKGNLSDWIIIRGTNLCNVKTVVFNDVVDSLKSAFITPNEITLAIPRAVPANVTNKITVQAPGGSATYEFEINIPEIVVTGMNNEYTPEGATMVILGKNFDLYEITPEKGKVFFGNQEAAVDRNTPDSVFVKVPAGIAAGTKLKMKDGNGVEYTVPGQYRDPRGILWNYDPYTGWNSGLIITNGPVPAPISGNYAYVKGNYNAWEWNENYHTLGNFTLANLGVSGPVSNYNIKFEINTLTPWTYDHANPTWNYTPLKFDIGLSNGVTYEYAWAPFADGDFATKGWKTITIPLELLKGNGASMPDITGAYATDNAFMRFFIHGGYAVNLDMAWDNFRIVPKD